MTELHQHTGIPPKISVLFGSDNEGVRKKFHCPVCGSVAFEYWGDLRGLVAGAENIQKEENMGITKVVYCRGKCKKYEITADGDLRPIFKNGSHGEQIQLFEPCKAQFYI